jgi:tetratricopeptide (TPR) repeat protein
MCSHVQGKYQEARRCFQQALLLTPDQARLWVEIGVTLFHENDLAKARRCYEQSALLLQRAGVAVGETWAKLRYEQAYCDWREGHYETAHKLALEARSASLPEDPNQGRIPRLLGLIAIVTGNIEEALRELQHARVVAKQQQQLRELAIICSDLGDLYLRRAVYKQAREVFEQALSIAQKIGESPLAALTIGNLGILALRQGDVRAAETQVKHALMYAQDHNDTALQSPWAAYLGQVLQEQGRVPEARAALALALTSARRCHFEPYLALALVAVARFHLQQTHLHKAKKALQQALSLAGVEAETQVEARLLEARITALEGHQEAAQRQFQAALEQAHASDVGWLLSATL